MKPRLKLMESFRKKQNLTAGMGLEPIPKRFVKITRLGFLEYKYPLV
jgi:hypothetical protein